MNNKITSNEGIIWALIILPLVLLLVLHRLNPSVEWQSQLIPVALLIIINFSFWGRQRLHISRQDVFNENTVIRHKKIRFGTALISALFMNVHFLNRFDLIDVEKGVLINWTSYAGFLLFAWMGNYVLTIKQNEVFGILNRWTLTNEQVWKNTHKWIGKIWFLGGILGCIIVFLFPKDYTWLEFPASMFLFMVFAFGTTIAAYVFSYFEYNKREVENG